MNFIFLWKMNEIYNIYSWGTYIYFRESDKADDSLTIQPTVTCHICTSSGRTNTPSFISMHLAACSPTICDETNSGRDSISRAACSYKQGRKSSIRRPTLRIWDVKPTKMWSISPFACRVSSGVPTNLTHCFVTNTSQLATRCDTCFSSPSSEYMYRNYILVVWSGKLN